MSCNLRDSLTKCMDKILGLREEMGAHLAEVHLISRQWAGERVGDGSYTDTTKPLSPFPQIKDYSHNIRVTEAGSVKSGDLILVGISRSSFPDEGELKTHTGIKNLEKFYKVGEHYYRVIHIKENLVTWDVHVRKVYQDENER